MPIYVNEETQQFHLQGRNVSYIFSMTENEQPGQLYYGKKVKHRDDFSHLRQLPAEPLGNAAFPYEGNQLFSLEFLKQEYPGFGTSDYREPAFVIKHASGSRTSHFIFKKYEILNGKPGLEGLPATYTESDDEAETLVVTLKDSVAGLEMDLFYTVYHDRDAIVRSVKLRNVGDDHVVIERLLSTSVDLPHADFEFLHLHGSWIRERHVASNPLRKGLQSIDSKKGVSSSLHNPFFALKSKDATESHGEVYGFNLVYSGNFFGGVEVDLYDTSRALMGMNPFGFEWKLESGEEFQAPEAVMVYSDQGLNGMSQSFHRLYESRLVRGEWREKERPILINNWEATYFDFDEEKILDICKSASELGIELFALDDGWFQGRNDDTTSLGDWTVDHSKLPNGIEGLSQKVNGETGMSFGLWVEPEMISEKSDLYKAHPDWVLGVKDRPLSHGRNQFILDLSKQEVVDYLDETLSGILSSSPISYVKWDMNRNMTEVGSDSVPADRQGEVSHRYVLGLYELLDRLTSKFPHILFESCASGGNRFDPGMLYYMPQTWTSDNTDAIERLKIQWGTSLVYPLSSMGAHVSSCPNHQTGRSTPLDTRFNVSMFGAFGYELDATRFSEEEKIAVKKQVNFVKENRKTLQFGSFYRLISPFEGNDTAWMVADVEKGEAIVAFYRTLAVPNPSLKRIRLQGLKPDALYEIDATGQQAYGDELMNIGLLIPPMFSGTVTTDRTMIKGDFASLVWKLSEVK
ncbi:alpha-galactosidase [Rossellomorea aquimaris]|uniref:alpha-galactosidase n=1 Tax=Rossellomorea aquimaris TaxID=189382 RepID=UPI001CD78ED5|nr:alpha-galactosidase [Rossellomorea aquimaris]MCA1055262.1 alpha-galactosidase [Rossellomorea aquimaris]